MGCIYKFSIGILLITVSALFCTPGAVAASDHPPTTEVMQASGGLTLGSAALVALAGVVIAFGKVQTEAEEGSELTPKGISGRLCKAAPEEQQYDE